MKLEVYKEKVKVLRDSLQTKELRALTKQEDLLYVFFLCDLINENPLADLSEADKEHEARLRAYGDTLYTHDNLEDINRAIKTYPITNEQKDIAAYNKKMDQFGTLLEDTSPKIIRNVNEGSNMISFSTNMDIINGILKDITNLIQAKASLVAMYTTGAIPNHLRGGLSPLSKGKIKLTKDENKQ